MNRNNIKKLMVLTAVMMLSMRAFAYQTNQANNPPEPSLSTSSSVPPPGLPIDGFLIYCLAAGTVLGIRSLKKER